MPADRSESPAVLVLFSQLDEIKALLERRFPDLPISYVNSTDGFDQTLEPFDRDEARRCLELCSQSLRRIEIVLLVLCLRPDFEDDGDHDFTNAACGVDTSRRKRRSSLSRNLSDWANS